MDHMHDVTAHLSGGDHEKHPKVVHHIEIHKSATKGDHHITRTQKTMRMNTTRLVAMTN